MQPINSFLVWSSELLLVLSLYSSYISCQQFTFNNNAPVPPRFLVPGAFAVPAPPSQQVPIQQNKRLLPTPTDPAADDESVRRFRKPVTRTRPPTVPANAFPLEQEFELTDNTPRVPEISEDRPNILAFKPVAEPEIEDDTPFSTFAPTVINTVPQRTFRPTRPPTFAASFSPPSSQFFRSSTNLVDEEDNDQTTRGQLYDAPQFSVTTESSTIPSRRPNPENVGPNFQRKHTTVLRPNNQIIRNNPQQQQQQQHHQPQAAAQEFVDNKIVRTYDKPAKSKFEKSGVHEKRAKKPVAQVLRRYREDNPDGSITWGFENDDGSYKEETIGNDCVTRGKYGYIDPDGVRREYTYSQGLLCDKTKKEESEENNSATYVDYTRNKVILPNGESVDLDNMVKHRARKPIHLKN